MISLAEASLSERGTMNYEVGIARTRYTAVFGKLWQEETNPNGIICLGVAENVS